MDGVSRTDFTLPNGTIYFTFASVTEGKCVFLLWHLCDWDHSICYLWSAQAFYGFTLEKLKMEVDAMMAYENPKGFLYL